MSKLSPQQRATLRVCASCEWVYKGNAECCPQCGFVSYGARYVHGDKAYNYAKTQKPWKNKMMRSYEYKLDSRIRLNKYQMSHD